MCEYAALNAALHNIEKKKKKTKNMGFSCMYAYTGISSLRLQNNKVMVKKSRNGGIPSNPITLYNDEQLNTITKRVRPILEYNRGQFSKSNQIKN